MATLEALGPADLRAVVASYRDALQAHRDAINRLNVYPVPDGDTGTNMALTLESVVNELDGADSDMPTVCKAISHGSLMGARGNSGVILAQVMRGLAGVLAERDAGDGGCWAAALVSASAAAYEAVGNPVEGTILTVVREASEAADAAAGAGGSLVEVLQAARDGAQAAVEKTPELLPVLAQNGVVDAGGVGLVLLFDALLHVADGRPVPEPEEGEGIISPDVAPQAGSFDAAVGAEHGDVSDLRYEVMYLLEAPDESISAFRDVWTGIGDSIVVVGGDGLWNCHIHTDDIGAAVEAALDCGRPRQIRVTDLAEQVLEERWVREAAEGPEDEPEQVAVPTAVVAVGVGEGIKRIFHSLGVQAMVGGGQGLNPSTSQILEAVKSVAADEVVVLPNNKNIVAVAEQVDGQSDRVVRVVPTRSIPEGFAALLAYDPQASADDNVEAMAGACDLVVTAEVTQAVRDSSCDAGPIHAGDFIGVTADGIVAVDAELAGAAVALLESMVGEEHELVTIIVGEGASAGVTRQITEWLDEHRPDVAPEVHHGGQPLYHYFFGIE